MSDDKLYPGPPERHVSFRGDSHEVYWLNGQNHCRNCGKAWKDGEPEPPLPCTWEGTHVFAGEPDARQSSDMQAPTSRFRPTYRGLSDGEKQLHDAIKEQAAILEDLMGRVDAVRDVHGQPPQPRYNALAMTALEQSVMWSIKALTA